MMLALEHWAAGPPALVLAGVLGVHEYGRWQLARHGRDSRTPRESARQAWLLRAGLAWGTLTLVSPLGYWSHELMFARVSLDLSFACLVAPLLVLGAPWPVLRAAAAGMARHAGAAGGWSRPARPRPAPGTPVVALAAFTGSLVLWQVPAVLDPSVRSTALWSAQIVCYLAAGALLWLQIVGSHPFEPGWDPVRRIRLIAGALGVTWLSGVALVISTQAWYPAFAGGPGTPLSKVMDQGLAGAITCVLPLIPLGTAAFWCFSAWITWDEDEARLQDLLQRTGSARPGPAAPGPGPVPD